MGYAGAERQRARFRIKDNLDMGNEIPFVASMAKGAEKKGGGAEPPLAVGWNGGEDMQGSRAKRGSFSPKGGRPKNPIRRGEGLLCRRPLGLWGAKRRGTC